MDASDFSATDQKAVNDTQAICRAILEFSRSTATQQNLETRFLERILKDTLHSVYSLSRAIAGGQRVEHCFQTMDLSWDEASYAFMADLLRPMDIGLAEVLMMSNPSREGIHTLDDMRAFCERVKMDFPYYHSIIMYPAGNLEAIVKGMKNPTISSDIEVITVWTP